MTLPSVAPAENKQKKRSASKKGTGSVAEKITEHCCCSIEEIESIVNSNGLNYNSLLHCVENGYLGENNLYSKKYWDSMDVDDPLRDDTYEEYLVGMYRSNPDGLDCKQPNKPQEIIVNDCLAYNDVVDDNAIDDMSWLDGLSDWTNE
jgi:hypothetical protein